MSIKPSFFITLWFSVQKTVVPGTRFELARSVRAPAPQAGVSTNSTTWALF